MLSNMIRRLPCDLCEDGELDYDQRETMKAWQQPEVFRLDDIDKLDDGIMSDILVMVCGQCGNTVRYTLKEIERACRRQLSSKLLTMISRGDIPDPGSFRKTDRISYYCGRCNGYDGKGACPTYVYKNCDLRRMPYGF